MAFTKAGRYDEVLLRNPASNAAVRAVTSADVYVFESDGVTAATLYADRDKTGGAEADNVVSPDSSGNLEFFANPGTYVIKIYVDDVLERTDTVVVAPDPDELENTEAGTVNVLDHGATGDGATDDSEALQEALDAADALGGATVYVPPGTYVTSDTLTVGATTSLIMDGSVQYSGDGTALEIGEEGVKTGGRQYRLRVTRDSTTDWSTEDSIGVLLINLQSCQVHLANISGFTIGVQCLGAGAGFVYNHIEIGTITDAKVALDLTNKTVGGTIGWCNENIYIGGRFRCFSSTNTALDRWGVRIGSQDGTYTSNNNNVFHKPSFELQDGGAGTATCVLVVHGQDNHWRLVRTESNDELLVTQNDSLRNTVEIGYGSGGFTDEGRYGSSFVDSQLSRPANESKRLVWDSGPMHQRAAPRSDGVHVPGLFVVRSTGATDALANGGVTINDDHLAISGNRALGTYLTTERCRRFCVSIDGDAGGRLVVRCHAADGTILTDADPNHPYVQSPSNSHLTWLDAYGGVYRTQGDSLGDRWFAVHSDVAYIFVGIANGTDNAELRSIKIYTPDLLGATSLHPFPRTADGLVRSDQIPTTGTWEAGHIIWHDQPVAGEPLGWVCVAAGTPGTWEPFSVVDLLDVANTWASKQTFSGEIEVDGDLNHDGSNVGFFGATPTAQPGATDDIKDALVALGLLTDAGATPLNLDGGDVSVGSVTLTGRITTPGKLVIGTATASAAVDGGIAIGKGAASVGDSDIAIGEAASTASGFSVAVGRNAAVASNFGVAIGFDAAAYTSSTAVGRSADADAISSLALGNSSTVTRGHDNAVAIGVGSATTAADQIVLGRTTTPPEVVIPGAINHDGSTIGFYGATPVAKAAATDDIKDSLVALGLITDSDATPLDLDGGDLTAGGVALGSNIRLAESGTTMLVRSLDGTTPRAIDVGGANIGGILDHSGASAGFFDATPVAQQSAPADATGTDATQINAIRDALVNLGLMA